MTQGYFAVVLTEMLGRRFKADDIGKVAGGN
jgi:hypothetical protein